MFEYFTLADGTVVQEAYVVCSRGSVWFYVHNGVDIRTVFALMSDPEKTAEITMGAETYRGYTDLISIRRDDVLISGQLSRPE